MFDSCQVFFVKFYVFDMFDGYDGFESCQVSFLASFMFLTRLTAVKCHF